MAPSGPSARTVAMAAEREEDTYASNDEDV